MFDCIVVGAGPAGSAAAYELAKRGRSTLVVERSSWPRSRPCGGGVAPAIAEWFDFDFSPTIACTVKHIRMTWKGSNPVDIDLESPQPLWCVDRAVFDDFLIRQAIAKGAEFRPDTEVTGIRFDGNAWQVETPAGPLQARYLIGADGPQGPMAGWLKLKQSPARSGAVLDMPGPPPSGDRATADFAFGTVKNGFVWSLPKGFPDNGDRSVSAATVRGGEPRDIAAPVTEFVKQSGLMPSRTPTAFPMRIWDGDRVLHGQNAVLAGEAASTADPFTGEGIRPAVKTGLQAAEAIEAALNGDSDALARYSETVAKTVGTDMAWAQRLAGLFHRFPGLAYKVSAGRPSVQTYMGKLICGELDYTFVADRAITRLKAKLLPGMGGG